MVFNVRIYSPSRAVYGPIQPFKTLWKNKNFQPLEISDVWMWIAGPGDTFPFPHHNGTFQFVCE